MNESSDSFEVNPNNSAAGSTGSSSGDTPAANTNTNTNTSANTNASANANSTIFDEESQLFSGATPASGGGAGGTSTSTSTSPIIINREVSMEPFGSLDDDNNNNNDNANEEKEEEEGHPAPAPASGTWSAISAASKFMSNKNKNTPAVEHGHGHDSDEEYISSASEDEDDDEGLSLDATTVNTKEQGGVRRQASNRNKTIIINSRFDTNSSNNNNNKSTTNGTGTGTGTGTDTTNGVSGADTMDTSLHKDDIFPPDKDKDNTHDNDAAQAQTFSTYSAIRSIVYAPSGKTITVGGDRKKVTTFSPPTSYTVVKEHRLREGAVLSMCYSPDGRYLYVGGDDEKVSVFASSESQSPFGFANAHGGYHHQYNKYKAGTSNSNNTRTTARRKSSRTSTSDKLAQSYLSGSSNTFRDSLMSRGNNNRASILSTATTGSPTGAKTDKMVSISNGTGTTTPPPAPSPPINPFPYGNPQPNDPNSSSSSTNGERLYQYEINQDVEAIAHSPRGNYIAVGGSDKKVLIYNTDTKELEREFDVGGWILDLKYSPDGKYLAVAGYDAVGVSEFDLTNYEKVTYYEDIVGDDDNHLTKSVNGDEEAFDSDDDDNNNANGPKVVHADEEIGKTPSLKTSGIVRSIAYSPDGKYLVLGGSNKKVIIYNTSNHEVVATHKRSSEVNAIAYSPDGSYIAVGGDGGKVTIYNTDADAIAAAEVAAAEAAAAEGGSSSTSPSNQRRNKKKKKKSQMKEPHSVQKDFETEHAVFAIDISPDGNFVSVGGYSERVTVFNISIPTMLKEFDMNGDVITKIDSEAYRQEIYARNRIDPKKEALNALGIAGILSGVLGMLILIIYLLK